MSGAEPRSSFVEWALGVSVRTKIMGALLVMAVLLGLGVTRELRVTFMRTLREEIEREGLYVARAALNRATPLLLADTRVGLRELATGFCAGNRSVQYIVFRDREGRILAHTFVGPVPEAVRQVPAPPESVDHRTTLIDSQGQLIRDVAVRPLRRDAGYVQVGVTEEWLHRRVREMTHDMLVVTVMLTLVVLGAGYLLTGVLTRPLRDLTEIAGSVAEGDFSQRAFVTSQDEIGKLAAVLNLMCERLTNYRREIEYKERMRVDLLQRLIGAQEEERKRVARELHDQTSQSLTSLAVELKALEAAKDLAEVRRHARRLREVASTTLGEVHHLATELRPTLLDDLGLVAAVEHHVEELRRRHGVSVDFETVGPWDPDTLPAEAETALYRICQEALTNAVRHAEARRMSVVLTRRPNSLVAIIEDDGKGFSVDEVLGATRGEENLGLFGMQERAALLGGKLTIESNPGCGTTVFVEIPCPSEREESE